MAMGNLLEPPAAQAMARFADDTPRFLLTVDTEEAVSYTHLTLPTKRIV